MNVTPSQFNNTISVTPRGEGVGFRVDGFQHSVVDPIYVNGDNDRENVKAADDIREVRPIGEALHRKMFYTEDA